ncbi:MAG: hypothetical protein M5R40_24995 [Anaerolineae bacterium]|nr:hypothetical protein [Anaerolineae bacterium]
MTPPAGAAAQADLDDAHTIVERWIRASGWNGETTAERMAVLLKIVDLLCRVHCDAVPLAWLLFPMNAAQALHTLATQADNATERQRDRRCAAILRCYAMALQAPCCKPAEILDPDHTCPLGGHPLTGFD